MKILLFGVSNVGKTTTGEILAERLGYTFYDLDEEVKAELHMTMEEFVHTANLRWRDHQRGNIIKKLLCSQEDMVLAVTPISYPENFKTELDRDDILSIELYDTPENIFSRLVFSDENDNLYKDDEYKNAHREYYLKDIQEDLYWYGQIYDEMGIHDYIIVDNKPQEEVAEQIISQFHLLGHD